MQSYDISHLPQPVHDAVLHLMETLVQAFPEVHTILLALAMLGTIERTGRGYYRYRPPA